MILTIFFDPQIRRSPALPIDHLSGILKLKKANSL